MSLHFSSLLSVLIILTREDSYNGDIKDGLLGRRTAEAFDPRWTSEGDAVSKDELKCYFLQIQSASLSVHYTPLEVILQ